MQPASQPVLKHRSCQSIGWHVKRAFSALLLSLGAAIITHFADAQTTSDTTNTPDTISIDESYNAISLNTNGEPFTARFDQAVTPYQIALLGFFPDNMHYQTPDLLHALHETLPLAGWQTLSFALTGPLTGQIEQLKAGTAFLKQNTAQSVALVSFSDTVSRAMQLAIDEQDFVSGLVLWKIANDQIEWDKLEQLQKSRVSILDVAPSDMPKRDLELRRHRFRLAGFTQYYQIIQISKAAPSVIGAKRIRAWLSTNFEK